MSEQLGDAVLVLRTDDSKLTDGIRNAKAEAGALNTEFKRTAASATDASRGIGEVAQTSEKAGTAIRQTTTATGESLPALQRHATALDKLGDSSKRAAFQQKLLVFQLNDIGVSLASGMNPLMVMIQQGSQISQIYGSHEGGIGRAFKETGNIITGLATRIPVLTAAVAAAGAVIGGMTIEINRQSKETVSLGDVALATWQVISEGLTSILKPVIEAISPWFEAAWIDAVAVTKGAGNLIINSVRLVVAQIGFVWSNFPDIVGAAVVGAVNKVIDGVNLMIRASVAGVNMLITAVNAVGGTQIGQLSGTQFEHMGNPAAGRLGKAWGKFKGKASGIMDDDPVGDIFDSIGAHARANARARNAKKGKKDGGADHAAHKKNPANDNSDERFESDLNQLGLQILTARRSLATTAEERYRLERASLALSVKQEHDQIAHNDKYSQAQKDKLFVQLQIREALEGELIARKEAEEKARDALQISQAANQNERDFLQKSSQFAVTRQERRDIELKLLDLAYQQERAELDAVIASQDASEAQKKIAAERLKILDSLKGKDAQQINRDNESPMERYRREVRDAGKSINDDMERISVDGLQSLNNGLAEAIMGARSLGDVFKSVANQIIADLLRIFIQQTLIQPLLNALGGGGAQAGGGYSGGGGLGGILKGVMSIFGGFNAAGGMIPEGQFGIVGEKGPEPVFATPRGALVRPNSALSSAQFRPSSPSINMPINIDATGADSAALARVASRIDQLQAELPGTIVRTVQDAGDRRMISSGGWR